MRVDVRFSSDPTGRMHELKLFFELNDQDVMMARDPRSLGLELVRRAQEVMEDELMKIADMEVSGGSQEGSEESGGPLPPGSAAGEERPAEDDGDQHDPDAPSGGSGA